MLKCIFCSLIMLAIGLELVFPQGKDKDELLIGVSGYGSLALGLYSFKPHENITANGGANAGWGVKAYIYHVPIKHFVYGVGIGFVTRKFNLVNLNYNLHEFETSAGYQCPCYNDTIFTIRNGYGYHVPIIAKAGWQLNKKGITQMLGGGLGTLINITPSISLDEDIINPPPFSNTVTYIRTVYKFNSRVYPVFAYNLFYSLGYRFKFPVSVNFDVDFYGTLKRAQPYITSPAYGYHGYVMYINLGAGITFDISTNKKRDRLPNLEKPGKPQ